MALDVLKRYYSQLGLALCLAISGAWVFIANQAQAQITPDATLPQGETSQLDLGSGEVNGKIVDLIKGGAIRDINLFHSFVEFNIDKGQRVYFANPAGIQNILSRVTGANPSNILGTLGVDGGANLFLINPKGILFGDKAKLDVSGSFVGTTADGIGFGNRGVFSASNPEPPSPLLTVNPNVFFFNQIPGKITSQAKLEKLAVDNLLLLGGDIEVSKKDRKKDSKISTDQGGNILLAGLGAPGEVALTQEGDKLGLDFPDGVKKADVLVKNSAIETSVAKDSDVDGGDIRIIANSIEVENSENNRDRGIFTKTENNGSKSGDIIITADESVLVRSTSRRSRDNGIFTMTRRKGGEGGKITIDTRSLTVETARREQGIFTVTNVNDQKSGDIIITADDSVSIIASSGNNQHGIFTFTDKKGGPGGSIEITTGSLMIESERPTPGISTRADGDGDTGSITIDVSGDVLLKDQGTIKTEQRNQRKGRPRDISLKVDGNVTLADNSRIKSKNNGKGTGGKITILAGGAVEIKYGSKIESIAQKDAEGNSGSIEIEADSLLLDARKDPSNPESKRGLVQITARTDSEAGGDGGPINIRVGSLTMIGSNKSGSDGITSNTSGAGKAGNITIIVDREFIMEDRAQIEARSQKAAKGDGGDITIKAGSLSLSNKSSISAEAIKRSKGNPGNIKITVKDKIEIIGQSSAIKTKINPEAGNDKTIENVGNITIQARSLSLKNGGKVEASTEGKIPAGYITVNATDFVEISGAGAKKNSDRNTRIVTETKGQAKAEGGLIQIETPSLRLSDGAVLNSQSKTDFRGGDIEIDANDVQLTDGAEIIATSTTSEGGNITLDSDTLTVNNSEISASTETGTAGNVEVNAKDSVLLTGNLPDKSKSPAGIFAQATEGGTARNVTIETDELTVEKGARIAVSGVPLTEQGFPETEVDENGDADESKLGEAGKLTIDAESLTLDNGQLVAATGQKTDNKEAATIDINVSGLTTLDNNSLILADATGDGVTGGNITIDGGLLILYPSDGETGNDIFANAEEGQGGNINITLQGLFGNFRLQEGPTRFNDISAINLQGNSSLLGSVQINSAVNPTQDPELLPTSLVDPSALIVANCPRSGKVAVDELGEFIVTGRGGLPPSPLDPITQRSVLVDWVTIDTEEETIEEATSTPTPEVSYLPMRGKRRSVNTPTPARPKKKIVEAQGWIVGEDGTIILTAEPNNGTPKSNWYSPRYCGSKG